ncbi:MAG: 4-alpha-glucanotransferase, partial [Eubacterium sp.]|nr:4-alpha-glucanotransferase [Eubacterium sp.]
YWDDMAKEDKAVAVRYMNCGRFPSKKKLTWNLICLAMASVSDLCVIPMQDYLSLPETARINIPSTMGGNWQWRMEEGAFSDKLCEKIRRMSKLYGRTE